MAKHFFPDPVEADLSDIPTTTYPDRLPLSDVVYPGEIRATLKKLKGNTAPGPDAIPNQLLKNCPAVDLPIAALCTAYF